VLDRIIKISFATVGAITGYTFINSIFSLTDTSISLLLKTSIFIFSIIFVAIIFYFAGNQTISFVLFLFDKADHLIRKLSLFELFISSTGCIIGLIIANLIVVPLKNIDVIGLPISVFLNIFFGTVFFAVSIVVGKRSDNLFDIFKEKKSASINTHYHRKLLDTCTIIDGRILDIVRTGCVEGDLCVPTFILEELRHISDSPDTMKRNRGKRGLDVLNSLQKEFPEKIKVDEFEGIEGTEADDKLLKAAKVSGSTIVTIDYNLNKVASVQNVNVLNINELANALKPIALPGDEMIVQIIKDGKENGQGVGYLDDGTMIVVECGRDFIGKSTNVVVTSVWQSAAGRMVFAKPQNID